MSTNTIEPINFSCNAYENNLLVQAQRETKQLEEQITFLGLEISAFNEKLETFQNLNKNIKSEIDKIKTDISRFNEESFKYKSIALVLFGCSTLATIAIFTFKMSSNKQ